MTYVPHQVYSSVPQNVGRCLEGKWYCCVGFVLINIHKDGSLSFSVHLTIGKGNADITLVCIMQDRSPVTSLTRRNVVV